MHGNRQCHVSKATLQISRFIIQIFPTFCFRFNTFVDFTESVGIVCTTKFRSKLIYGQSCIFLIQSVTSKYNVPLLIHVLEFKTLRCVVTDYKYWSSFVSELTRVKGTRLCKCLSVSLLLRNWEDWMSRLFRYIFFLS